MIAIFLILGLAVVAFVSGKVPLAVVAVVCYAVARIVMV